MTNNWARRVLVAAALVAAFTTALGAEAPESQRLTRAKDYIADEQWSRAIDELRVAISDAKESGKDEALYWLAHSEHQSGDSAAAVQTIRRLEQRYPKSLWVKPAYSLRIEIAQRLRRRDVLWWTALPPPPPPPAAPAPPASAAPVSPPAPPARTPKARRVAPVGPAHMPPPALAPAAPPAATTATPPTPPAPPAEWFTETYYPDTDLRIQALGSLIRTDADRVIPMLKKIALESSNPGEARRAVFVLAQSGRQDARSTVVEVAMNGPDPVRVAAVRELGRFGGAGLSKELLQVYTKSNNVRVKTEVVMSLGARAENVALLRIAQSESDRRLRDRAIVTLGQAGGGDQLQTLYARVAADAKRPIIMGLFHAGADDALIRIAERERDEALRQEVVVRLRLLGTPKALAYADKLRDR
jgi:hypothetical protein